MNSIPPSNILRNTNLSCLPAVVSFSTMVSPTSLYPLIVEFIITCTTLFLFLYGYPDTTRRCLWAEGGVHHLNSDPRLRIYFYANHLEPPTIPYIWSQTLVLENIHLVWLNVNLTRPSPVSQTSILELPSWRSGFV
jgi:hypothetical protein